MLKRLRVGMVSQSFPPLHGGVAEHVDHLSRELARRGHDVTVLTGGPPLRRNGHPWNASHPSENGGISVLRFGRTVRVRANGGSGCVVLWTRSLRKPFEERAFDLLHVHAPLIPTLPLFALRAYRGPVVATFHSAGAPSPAYRLFRRALEPFARRIDARIAVSRAAAAFVEPFFPGDYRIIPNGVDGERFRPFPLPDSDSFLTLLFVGRLDPRKGVDVLLNALPRVRKLTGREVRCLIAGDGPLRRRLKSRAARVPVPVTFLGAVERAALPEIYRTAHIVVAPALFGESFGVVLLEALASGRPVVASDVRGYSDVLVGCGGSLLAAAGSADDLAATIARAARPDLIHKLAGEGPRFARRFHWKLVAEQVEDVYRTLPGLRSDVAEAHGTAP